jgi:hypothetical protein
MVILFYYSAFKFDVLINMYFVFLPQALIVSLFAPVFFYLMRRVEVFFYGKAVSPAKRTGTDRISAEN